MQGGRLKLESLESSENDAWEKVAVEGRQVRVVWRKSRGMVHVC